MRLSLNGLQRRIAEHLRRVQEPGTPSDLVGEADNPAWAAVSVILAPDPDTILLIRRAERSDDPWSGHVGLPGGRLDPADADLRTTAIRETAEEVGVPLPGDGLLGALPDVWPGTPLPRVIVVRPFVFGLASRPALTLSDEVADAFWVPVTEFHRPSVYRDFAIRLRGENRVFPAYHLPQGVVWGLTERILTSLLAV